MQTRIRHMAASILLSLAPTTALAQEGTLDRFRPGETTQDDFHLSRPGDFGHLRFGAQLHVDYGLNPLVYESTLGDADSESLAVVEHQVTGTIGLAFGLFDRLAVFGGLPITLAMEGDDPEDIAPLGVAPADGGGLGDAYLGARVRILGDDGDIGTLGAQATVTFPTSVDSAYRGEPFLTVQPELLGEIRPIPGSHFRIVGNLGALLREETTSAMNNLQFRHELTYGLGLAVPVWTDAASPDTHLDVHGQLYGASAFELFGVREGTALEATAGLKLFHQSGIVGGLAGGAGLARGFGSPDLRLVAMVGWSMPEAASLRIGDADGDGVPDDRDACPSASEDMDGFEDTDGCPDADNDGDGIEDAADQCPVQPETVNQIDDTDGCPDAEGDRDGDGVLDGSDRCVDQAEDRDGFSDEDGCPDSDNDGDTVLDSADACPNVRGAIENRGCIDGDRDNDSVVDRLDNCPDEPGTVENRGCQAAQQVVIGEQSLQILEHVYFATNRATIEERSYPLLMNVANVLNSHPEITRVRVEGHTDNRGSRERNLQLSQQRAEAVVEFLATRGNVARSRLVAQGFGPDRPVVPNATAESDHARNRRVDFATERE